MMRGIAYPGVDTAYDVAARTGSAWEVCPTPTFIDRHQPATIPSAAQRQTQREALRGIVDEHGVQPLAHWVTDGVIYCVVRAPSVKALCQHHAERGLPCEDLRPITRLRGRNHPLSAKETQLVRAAINLWPISGVAA
jgi:(2Fe-2S) ferredoxin